MPITSFTESGPNRLWRQPLILSALILVYGLACLIVTPPFQAPDAGAHWYRAFQIAQGHFIAEKRGTQTGGELPAAPELDLRHFFDLPSHEELKLTRQTFHERAAPSLRLTPAQLNATSFVQFSNTARFSPVPYIPQAAAILVCELFQRTDIAALYLGALFSLFFSSACLLLAFRALDFSFRATWVTFVVAGLPMSSFLLASISADGPTIALCILDIALALRLRHAPTSKLFAGFLACTLFVSTARGLYFLVPLMALPLFVPVATLRTRQGLRLAAFTLGCALVPIAVWTFLTRNIYSIMNPAPNIDSAMQVQFMLHHLPAVLAMFAREMVSQFPNNAESFVGMLGWLEVKLPRRVLWMGYLLVALTPVFSSEENRRDEALGPVFRAVAPALFLTFTTLVCTFSYLTWVPVGANYVDGIQGRYFLPLAVPLLLALPPAIYLRQAGRRIFSALVLLAWVGMSANTIWILAHRYWAL